uniref:MHC class I-like antigen recognition-like domain-containing protein n=1 Tax=Oreochromis niloticus TaxID=8128 RepID=A0A669BFK6_ORENI
MGVIVIDGIQTVYCDRNSKTLEPRQDWMKKIFDKNAQMLEMFTQQCFVSLPSFFRTQISSLKQQFNQRGGVQILQIISGCEWDENTGEMTGVIKYGWNEEDFFEFDVKTLTWIALNPEALVTKQTWNTDRSVLNENFLTQVCPTWLKMYVDSGNFSLQRTVVPTVSVLQKTPFSLVTCHATGFLS